MTFEFKPAKREQVGLLIAFAGASGSGKTMSALRLAKGISPGNKIFFIDTEARRGLHYASQFDFMHSDMRSPFSPERFVEGIHVAESLGAEVVIIDSFSHEYDGPGGIMEWAEMLEEKGVKSPGNWKEPKGAHKKLMQQLLQSRCHLIFCLRADEKIRIAKNDQGRTVVEQLGWMPIQEKQFMYEMTASFTLIPTHPGRTFYDLPHKVQEQHRSIFPEGQHITEEAGRKIAEWAAGGEPRNEQSSALTLYMAEVDEKVKTISDPAELADWWGSNASKETRRTLNLSQSEVDDLKTLVIARIAELKAEKTA